MYSYAHIERKTTVIKYVLQIVLSFLATWSAIGREGGGGENAIIMPSKKGLDWDVYNGGI